MVQLSPRKGIVTLFVLRQGQADSGESCSVLQSGPTRSLVAKFPQHLVITCSMQISCCRGRMLQTRPQTGVCELDVVARKAPQNNRSYVFVRSADLPSDSLATPGFSMESSYIHGGPQKTTKLSKLGGGRLPGTIRNTQSSYLNVTFNCAY